MESSSFSFLRPKVGFARDTEVDDTEEEETEKLHDNVSNSEPIVTYNNVIEPTSIPPSTFEPERKTADTSHVLPSLENGKPLNTMRPDKKEEILPPPPPSPPIDQFEHLTTHIHVPIVSCSTNDDHIINVKSTAVTTIPAMEEKMTALKSICHQRVETAQKMAMTWSQISALEFSLEEAMSAVTKFEADQQRFAVQEEYDNADALNESIESVKKEMTSYTEQIKHLMASIPSSTSTTAEISFINASSEVFRNNNEDYMKSLQIQQMKLLDETKIWLETTINHETSSSNIKLDQLRQEQSADERRLRSEAERIALERSHVMEEEETLREQQMSTETAINTQVSDSVEQKIRLEQNISLVMSDIDELEKQLMLKRECVRNLTTELTMVDENINEVRHKFQRQLQHIEDRKIQVHSIQMSCSTDEQMLEEKWTVLRSSMAEAETARQEQECRCNDLKKGIDMVSMVSTVVSTSSLSSSSRLLLGSALPDDENSTDGEMLKKYLAEHHEIATELASTMAQHREARQTIVKLSSDLATIVESALSHEREKKIHAAAKRFREAAAVAKDEKVCLEQKEELERLIADKNTTASAIAETVELLTDKQKEVKRRLEQLQRKSESNRLSKIITRKNELSLVYDRMKNSMKNEGESNADDGCTGIITDDINQAMRLVLEAEMTLLDMEADEIRKRQGDDLTNGNDDNDDDDDDNEEKNGDHVQKNSVIVNQPTTPTDSDDITAEVKQMLLDIADLEEKQSEAATCEDYELAASIEESIVQAKHTLTQLQGTIK